MGAILRFHQSQQQHGLNRPVEKLLKLISKANSDVGEEKCASFGNASGKVRNTANWRESSTELTGVQIIHSTVGLVLRSFVLLHIGCEAATQGYTSKVPQPTHLWLCRVLHACVADFEETNSIQQGPQM